MNLRTLAAMAFLAVLLGYAPLVAADPPDMLAKKAVEQFLKAYKASDINGIMAAVDTPWFHDAKEVIKDAEQLKREFHKDLARDKDRAGLRHIIDSIVAYKSVREKLREEERKLADEVLQADDRVLLVRVGQDVSGGQGDKVAFLVRIKDGKAKVVGVKD